MGRPRRHSSSLPLPHDLIFGSSVEVSWLFLVALGPLQSSFHSGLLGPLWRWFSWLALFSLFPSEKRTHYTGVSECNGVWLVELRGPRPRCPEHPRRPDA